MMLEELQQCSLVPGVFGICVQLSLVLTSFTVLLIKYRIFEKPRRAVPDFIRDVAKLACGGALVHMLNLTVATILFRWFKMDSSTETADACDWYFINISLDTTLGVGINYVLLRLSQRYLDYTSGDYDTLPHSSSSSSQAAIPLHHAVAEAAWPTVATEAWRQQLKVWLVIVTIMKCIVTILMVLFHAQLGALSHSVFRSLANNPREKLLLVMVVAPLLLSAFQYTATDSFLKISPDRLRRKRSASGAFEDSSRPSAAAAAAEKQALSP